MKKQLKKLVSFGGLTFTLSFATAVSAHASSVYGYVNVNDRAGSSDSEFIYTKLCRCLHSEQFQAENLHLLKLSGNIIDREARKFKSVTHPYGVLAQIAAIWHDIESGKQIKPRTSDIGFITTSNTGAAGKFEISHKSLAGEGNILNILKRIEHQLGAEVLLLNVDGGWFYHPTFFTSLFSSRSKSNDPLSYQWKQGIFGDGDVQKALQKAIFASPECSLANLDKDRAKKDGLWDLTVQKNSKVLFIADLKNNNLYLAVNEANSVPQYVSEPDGILQKTRYWLKERKSQAINCSILAAGITSLAFAAYKFDFVKSPLATQVPEKPFNTDECKDPHAGEGESFWKLLGKAIRGEITLENCDGSNALSKDTPKVTEEVKNVASKVVEEAKCKTNKCVSTKDFDL